MDECKYCHESKNTTIETLTYKLMNENSKQGFVIVDGGYSDCFIDLNNNHLVVASDDISTKKINFCPICGRDLNKIEQDNETNL